MRNFYKSQPNVIMGGGYSSAKTLVALILFLSTFFLSSCSWLLDDGVPSGYGRITINAPGSRVISTDEIAQMTYKFYFNGEDYGSQNTAMFPVGSSLTIKIEGYVNGVLRASKTDTPFIVQAGDNYRNIVISRSRDEIVPPVPATSVSYSKGTAAYGDVSVISQSATYEQGQMVTVADEPTWGYGGVEYGNFTHWTANVDLEVTSGGSTSTIQKGNPITAGSSFTMPDSGVILTANWNATQFSINYTTTSGTGTATGNFDATQSTVQLNAGTGFNNGGNVLTKWQENGIDFGNPNEEISVQRLLDLLNVGNTSITLTANWEALPTFAVTFAPGDQASAQSMPSNLNTYNGGTINLTQKPTVTGYDFKGWKVTKSDGGAEITTLDENANSYTMPGEYAITLTAVWQAKTLKVKYNANAPQGSTVTGSVAETDRTYGSSFTLAQNSFSVQGYSFNGWFSAASGGQQVQGSSSTYMNNENDIDVFAQWTAIDINVTLNAGSGTGNDSSTLKFKLTDASATLPQTTTFTKAGYTLAGWSYSDTGNTANTFDEINTAIKNNTVTLTGTSKNTLTLYAVWEIDYKTDKSTWAVGDIVCANGNALTLTNYNAVKTDTALSPAVAVVYKNEANKVYIVGKVREEKAWCIDDADAYQKITELQTTVGGSAGNLTFRDYKDGSDGWAKLTASVNDSDIEGRYPAWEWANSYGTTQNLTGDLATGWYFPSVAELFDIWKEKNSVEAALTAVSESGSMFASGYYWSSSQSATTDTYACRLTFASGDYSGLDKTNNYVNTCAVRQFTW